MDNLPRIKRLSALLGRISTLLFWAAPFLCALFWAFFNDLPLIMRAAHLPPGSVDIPAANRALCFVVSLLPTGVAMYGFRTLRTLFGLYAAGEIFSPRNVCCYRGLGKTLLYWAGASFLNTPLTSLAMSAWMPPGQRHITVSIGSDELAALFMGAAVLVISWVMDEGRGIEEERALTI